MFFHYINDEGDFLFTLFALKWVSENAFTLLPLYNFDDDTGSWYHINEKRGPEATYLNEISFENGVMDQKLTEKHALVPRGISRMGKAKTNKSNT